MVTQEDSLLSPITAAADRSESTTLFVTVSEGSGLPQVLQQAFDDGARPPFSDPVLTCLYVSCTYFGQIRTDVSERMS